MRNAKLRKFSTGKMRNFLRNFFAFYTLWKYRKNFRTFANFLFSHFRWIKLSKRRSEGALSSTSLDIFTEIRIILAKIINITLDMVLKNKSYIIKLKLKPKVDWPLRAPLIKLQIWTNLIIINFYFKYNQIKLNNIILNSILI